MSFASGETLGGWTLGEVLAGGRATRFDAAHEDGRHAVISVYDLEEGGLGGAVHAAQKAELERWDALGAKAGTEGEWGVEAGCLWVALPEPAPRAGEEPWSLERALAFVAQTAELLIPVHGARAAHGAIDAWSVLTDPAGPRLLAPGARPGPMELHALGIHVDPRYAAPEVLDRLPPTPAADVFSLGLLLQRLVSGEHPVNAPDPVAALAARGEGELTLAREAQPYLAHLLAPLERRPANAREAKALLSGPPPAPPVAQEIHAVPRGRSRGPFVFLGVALALLLAAAVYAGVLSPAPADPTSGYRFDLAPYRE